MNSEPGSGKSRRYPGVSSFEDTPIHRKLFFGRDQEAYDLLQLVLADRVVVLFARSGVGKSSLIKAALLRSLRKRSFLPLLVRVSSADQEGPIAALCRNAENACAQALEKGHIDEYKTAPLNGNFTLTSFFSSLEISSGGKHQTPVVIVDQFEELFTLRTKKERVTFIEELGDLIRSFRRATSLTEGDATTSNPTQLKLVISMREDYLPDLQYLAGEVPAILKSRFRLTPLSPDSARHAISKPAQVRSRWLATRRFAWSDQAVDRIVSYLSTRGDRQSPIEAFQLQVVCQYVEDLVAADENLKTIEPEHVGSARELEKLWSDYYEDALKRVCGSAVSRRLESRVRDLCEKGLINPDGQRRLMDEPTIKDSYHLDTAVLARMVDNRLLHKEMRRTVSCYELTHDTLVGPILESNARRRRRRRLVRSSLLSLCAPIVLLAPLAIIVNLKASRADSLLSDRAVSAPVVESLDLIDELQIDSGVNREFDLLDWLNPFDPIVAHKWTLPSLPDLPDRKAYELTVRSDEFEPYLIVRGPRDVTRIGISDPQSSSAQVILGPSAPNSVVALVGVRNGSFLGGYSIVVEPSELTLPRDAEDLASINGIFDALTAEAPPEQGGNGLQMSIGGEGFYQLSGDLTIDDKIGEIWAERWHLVVESEAQLRIDVQSESEDFDPYLFARSASGVIYSNDDRSSGLELDRNPLLEFNSESGPVDIIVTHYGQVRERDRYSM